MKPAMYFLCFLLCLPSAAQKTDTLTFFSAAFQEDRTIFIHTPEFYKYKSENVKLPVIFVLDGQHDWFVNPVLNNIKYLQYTKQMPQALIVVVPHKNRVKECAIKEVSGPLLPLHTFVTEELPEQIKPYHPSGINLIIGHSFSASFALYSYMHTPGFYEAVLAHSPIDNLDRLATQIVENRASKPERLYISVGGKQDGHRKLYDQIKHRHQEFFRRANTMEVNSAAHNSIPIVATPAFLSDLFNDYSNRFNEIAKVGVDYKLILPPKAVKEDMAVIQKKSVLFGRTYPPELPDINGIASRYYSSNYLQHATAVYEHGAELYPNYYEFQAALGELYAKTDKPKARNHFAKAVELLKTIDKDLPEHKELLEEVEELKRSCGL